MNLDILLLETTKKWVEAWLESCTKIKVVHLNHLKIIFKVNLKFPTKTIKRLC